jgi:hypothetical protein
MLELTNYGSILGVAFEDPGGQRIELVHLPSEDGIHRVRSASTVEQLISR